MSKANFENTVEALFKGMDHVLSTKTVVGEPQVIGETIIVPLVDVSFGMGAGAFGKDTSDSAGGGIGGKMSPNAVLVIQNGESRIVNVKTQDAVTKILDMVPGTVNKITSLIKGSKEDPEVEDLVKEETEAESVREEL